MIVPALLTDNKEKLVEMLNICKEFTNFVQVDVMDGQFVPSKSVTKEEIASIKSPVGGEAHIMVNNPVEWIEPFKSFGVERIIFHVEIDADKNEVISAIRKSGLGVGVAINPDTDLTELDPFIDKVDLVLFMSVIPGFYGAPFVQEVLDKVKIFRQKYPDMELSMDGGLKSSNVKTVSDLGVKFVCVGSAILKADNPKEAYKNLLYIVNE